MPSSRGSISRLLDIAADATSETVRSGALRRVVAMRRAEAERLRAAAPPAAVRDGLRDADIRIGPSALALLAGAFLPAEGAGGQPAARTGRRVAPSIARLAANLAAFGVPARPVRPRDAAAERLARAVLGVDASRAGRVVEWLGRAEAAFLCRDLDTTSATRLVRRLDAERAALPRLAALLPPPDADALRRSCRRLASLSPSPATGRELVASLGRGLLAGLISAAEPDTAAAAARRARCEPVDPAGFDPVWLAPSEAILHVEDAP